MTNKLISPKLLIYFFNYFIIINCYYMLNIATANHQKLPNNNYIVVFDNNIINKKPKQYRNANNLAPQLPASASAQPNLHDFQYIINKSSKNVFIIDLRQEPHAILNKRAISWYGYRNQVPNNLEHRLINQLSAKKHVRVYQGLDKLVDGHFIPQGSSLIKINKIITEKFLIEQELGANYLRILVTDHFAPNASQVDLFVSFVQQLPEDSWLHFHCRGGKGRSTTFMAIYDIIINGKNLTLDEILKRQYKLGGSKLSTVNFSIDRKKWKTTSVKDRYNFIKKFYDYVLDANGYNKSTWSTWLKNNP